MPIANVRYSAAQYGITSFTNINDQVGFWAINSSGQNMAHGDVVVFDLLTVNPPLATVTDINGAVTLTQASQTLTVDSTTGFPAAGACLVMAQLITGGPAVPVFVSYVSLTGTTFVGAQASVASITNGLVDEAQVSTPPSIPGAATGLTPVPGIPAQGGSYVGLPGTTGAGGVYVTYATAVGSLHVAGVVSVTGDASTTTTGQLCGAQQPVAGWTPAGIANGVIPPGGDVFVCTSGTARVQIGAATVAANALLRTDVIPRQAIGAATIGALLGIAQESQANKDANNTIRATIKVG